MPNWTSCKIDAYTNDEDALQAFLDTVKSEQSEFDFERIIPMPGILRNTQSGGTTIDGQLVTSWIVEKDADGKLVERLPTPAEQVEFEAVGYTCWYDWCVDNWGCKWPPDNVEITRFGGLVEITFDTPWSEPGPIFVKLREMFPLVEFEFRWRYEDESPYPHSM